MVKVIFEYKVEKAKQEDYLEATRGKIKPFWEANGCKSYSVWQEDGSEIRFVKEMLFDDMSSMKKTMSLKQAEPFKNIYYDFAADVSRKIITKKV